MRSNLECWKALQEADYFGRHSLYEGGNLDGGRYDLDRIERFVALAPHQVVVVIGCGYGRESAHICRRVATVYGIDVCDKILDRAVAHLRDRFAVHNFRPVLAERYAADIPQGVDLVYSVAVMQHLTRDIVRDYLQTLGAKLAPGGCMVIQFLQSDSAEHDAELRVYEPSVSWAGADISAACEAAGLCLLGLETGVVRPGCLWHWAHIGRA